MHEKLDAIKAYESNAATSKWNVSANLPFTKYGNDKFIICFPRMNMLKSLLYIYYPNLLTIIKCEMKFLCYAFETKSLKPS